MINSSVVSICFIRIDNVAMKKGCIYFYGEFNSLEIYPKIKLL